MYEPLSWIKALIVISRGMKNYFYRGRNMAAVCTLWVRIATKYELLLLTDRFAYSSIERKFHEVFSFI